MRRLLAGIPACGFLLLSAATLAAQDDCKPVFEALDKVMGTPTHLYATTDVGGKPKTTETLYSGTDIFVKSNIDGAWAHNPVSTKQMAARDREDRAKAGWSCSYVKDDTVNGQKAAVYKTHFSDPGSGKTEGQIWIDKGNGLPLRHEIDAAGTGKDAKKRHYSVRYDYKDVTPPKL